MSWARLDDAILDNPKILSAGPLGFALHVAAITWCARNLTDGFLPIGKVGTLLNWDGICEDAGVPANADQAIVTAGRVDPYTIAEELAGVLLWHQVQGGYQLHDFLKYNRSKAEVLKDRDAARVRMNHSRSSRDVQPNNGRSSTAPVPVPSSSPDVLPGISGASVPKPTVGGEARAPRARPLTLWPDDFKLTEDRRAVAVAFGLDPAIEWNKYKDSALAHGRRYANWDAAWRSWCRNADRFAGGGKHAAR